MLRSITTSLLLGAAALSIAAPAVAQDASGRDWRSERGNRADRGQRADTAAPAGQDPRGNRPDFRGDGNDRQQGARGDYRPVNPSVAPQPAAVAQRDGRNDGRYDQRGPGFRGDVRNDGRYNDGRYDNRRDDRRFDNNGRWNNDRFRDNRGWNNDWRNDRRYNWQDYRRGNRDRFLLPRYYGPRGYDYRRWSPGYRIDPYFYGRGYWISDPYAYRLPPAYGSYRWVRYYDDVLLVDITSGLIRDALYSFFWSR